MTAPEIPESALAVGETNLQVVGRLTSVSIFFFKLSFTNKKTSFYYFVVVISSRWIY